MPFLLRNLLFLLLIVGFFFNNQAQHTFSIVAVDSVTGEIGSAGATCGDSIIWPGTPGAYIISDILPGVGAIHTQSYYESGNQTNARQRMQGGDSPQQVMDWLQLNDIGNDPARRQYGAVDYNNGHPRSAAFTGANCFDHKNHITGPGYAIQGNILLGQQILDSMEARYLRTTGSLADRLMASMQGANVVGADSRCMAEGTSSLSAFLRVAKPSDHPDTLYLDINVAGTASGVEPINVLQTRFNNWTPTAIDPALQFAAQVYPNPASEKVTVAFGSDRPDSWQAFDSMGRLIASEKMSPGQIINLDVSGWAAGSYQLIFSQDDRVLGKKALVVGE
jgi:uncharacterized Ntn-hydrolase superfamily protein